MTAEQYRKTILSMCYQMNWTFYSEKYQRTCVDYNRLNKWMLQYGYLKKPLNDYKANELPKLFKQFKTLKEDVVSKQIKQIEEE